MAIYTTTVYPNGSIGSSLTITFTAIDGNSDNFITFDELTPGSTFTLAWLKGDLANPPSFTVSDVIENFTFDEAYFQFDIVTNKFGSGASHGLYIEFPSLHTDPFFWYLHDNGDTTGGCVVDFPCLETSFSDVTIKYSVSYATVINIDLSPSTLILTGFPITVIPNLALTQGIFNITGFPITLDMIDMLHLLKVTYVGVQPYLDIDIDCSKIP
jgi:hypothetical protein